MAKVCKVDEFFDYGLLAGASCAFGVFDGVHRGHRFLIEEAMRTARASGSVSVALTFDIDPDERFHADRLKKLMSNERRIEALAATGVDVVAVLPFTSSFAAQQPLDFLASTFGDSAPGALHVGRDFRFGAKAAGAVGDLRAWADSRGTRICAHDLKSADGVPITATRIRGLLSEGRCEQAETLLGHPYVFSGTVRSGRGEGAEMGFCTANIELAPMMQALGEGVYAAWAFVGSRRYRAAMSMGASPTFSEATATSEVHILDFSGSLYGETIVVEPVHFLRPMMKFDSVDSLVATVQGNISWVREHLEHPGLRKTL